MKKRDLERHLRAHNCRFDHQGAKHEYWENQMTGRRTIMPRHREVKLATARGMCRQLGVPPPTGSR